MRKLIVLMSLCIVLGGAYAAWPFVAAFQIKQAIKDGDVATLERKVHWAPVRASLKASLARSPASRNTNSHAQVAADRPDGSQPRAGFWSRIKAAAVPMMAERLIDTYVTAEGISKLQQAQRNGMLAMLGFSPAQLSSTMSGALASVPTTDVAGFAHRFMDFYRRIVRARFHTLSSVEIEIADKNNPERRFVSQFELSGFEWKLASVRFVGAGL